MPRFSILVTNRNHGKFLPQSLGSAIWQTFKDWELVFVDDSSTDNSVAVFEKFRDFRMKLVRLKRKVGVGRAKRIAAEKATGEILCVLDSDDAITRTALEDIDEMYKMFPEVISVYTQHLICDMNLIPVKYGRCGPVPSDKTYLDLLCGPPDERVLMSAMRTFKKSAYSMTEGYCALPKSVDKDIMLKIEEVGQCMFLNKALYLYRYNPDGVSLGTSRNISMKTTRQVVMDAKKRRGLV